LNEIWLADLYPKSRFLGVNGSKAVIIESDAEEKSEIPAAFTALILN
jgi:hypothetical protein